MKNPTTTAFAQKLAEYRQRWPRDGYHDSQPRFLATYKILGDHYEGGTILDVGGWPGDFACSLAMLGFPVVVLDKDLSRPTTKVRDDLTGKFVLKGSTTIGDKCGQYGIRTVQCDIERERIPLDDQSMDFIVFTEVMEHLRLGLLPALRELHRVLKPGGRLLVTTPNLLSLRNRTSFLLGLTTYDTLQMPYEALAAEERVGHGGHFRVFSMPEVIDLLRQTGFRVLFRAYRHFLPENGHVSPLSLYGIRTKIGRLCGGLVGPFRNTLCLVLCRDRAPVQNPVE